MTTLSTARLTLRPFTIADVSKIYALSREEGIRRWIPDQVYRDEAHAEEVLRALWTWTAAAPAPAQTPYVLGIEHDGVLVGHVGLSPCRGSVEIGYAIESRLQGRGMATEVVTAMTAWALRDLDLPEVLGVVGVDNTPSRRVLEKAGFVADPSASTSTILVCRQRQKRSSARTADE